MTDIWRVRGLNPGSDAASRLVPVRGERHPALLLAVLVAIGVCVADRADAGPLTWLTVALIPLPAIALSLLTGRYRSWLIPAAMVFAVSVGALRMAVDNVGRPSPLLSELINSGGATEVVGRLAGIPRDKPTGWSVPIDVDSVRHRSRTVSLRVCALLTTRVPMTDFRHGDHVRFMARFEAPFVRRNPGGFDYARHLFRQGIDVLLRPSGPIAHSERGGSMPSMMNLVEPVRSWLRATFTARLPKPARSLILGYLLGDTDQLAPGVIEAFRDSGTLHLLAVSGANVWLMVGLFYWPLRLLRVPRWPRAIILIVLVIAFSFLTRNEPSVVRASLMVAFILLGRLLYRPVNLLNAVGASAVVILIAAPSQLFRPGFQLSYAAVIAIAVVGQRVTQLFQSMRPRWARAIVLAASSSVAATVATAPIVAWHFGTVSLVSLVANLAMIPLAAAGLYTCLVVVLLSAFSSVAAGWMAYPAARILELSSQMASMFSQMPGSHLAWPDPSPIWVVHLYLAGVLAINWRHRYRWVRPAAWYTVAIVTVLISESLLRPRVPVITLAYLDTGATRIAAFSHPDGSLVWLADDPGIDDGMNQWVIAPFVRAQIGEVTTERVLPWRRTDPSDTALKRNVPAKSKFPAPVWCRYLSALDPPAGGQRIWADRFSWGRDTVFCLRDYPVSPPGVDWLDSVLGRGQTLVLPEAAPDRVLRRLLDHLAPRHVILFGSGSPWRDAEQGLERWRMRYPGIEFFCTATHGCVVIGLRPDSLTITPTIRDVTLEYTSPG